METVKSALGKRAFELAMLAAIRAFYRCPAALVRALVSF